MRRSPEALKRDAFVSKMLREAVERGQDVQTDTGWTPPDTSALVDATCRFVVERTVDATLDEVLFALARAGYEKAPLLKVMNKLRTRFAPEVLDA